MSVKCVGRRIEGVESSQAKGEARPSQRLTPAQARSYGRVIDWLNPKDRDILYLIFVSGKKQCEVQQLLGRSQPSLCYDIKRIRRRLHLIFYLHSVVDTLLVLLREHRDKFSSSELDILAAMFCTTSFTTSAKVLGVSQVRVRYVFDKCLRRLATRGLWEQYEVFTIIRHHLNTVRRVEAGEAPE